MPFFSEAQSWRKRTMTHHCSHERAPASAHASAHASVHESAYKSWLSLCCNPIQGSHSSAHVSAHAGAHASVHEVVWSYVIWSVFTCSVPYPFLVTRKILGGRRVCCSDFALPLPLPLPLFISGNLTCITVAVLNERSRTHPIRTHPEVDSG